MSLKEQNYTVLDSSVLEDIGFITPSPGWPIEAFGNVNSDLPSILVFYDSYGHEHYIGKYLAQQWSKAVFIHKRHLENIDKVVSRYKPDMVVIESAERTLPGFAAQLATIPELP